MLELVRYFPLMMIEGTELATVERPWERIPGAQGIYVDIFENTIDAAQSDGFVEGFVMRDHNGDEGTKWKKHSTIDLIVRSLVPGKGKHRGVIGALECVSTEGFHITNVGGLTDEERRRDDWVGRVVEVRYQYAQSKGKLRHPVLIRERPDMPLSGCSVNQDSDLADYWLAAD